MDNICYNTVTINRFVLTVEAEMFVDTEMDSVSIFWTTVTPWFENK